MNKLNTILVLAFICIQSEMLSQNNFSDRATQTESAVTLAKSSMQIEVGVESYSRNLDGNGSNDFLLTHTMLRYGLSEKIELRMLAKYHKRTYSSLWDNEELIGAHGIGDMEIGAKILLKGDVSSDTQLALIAHVSLPTGTEPFTADAYGVKTSLVYAHKIIDRLHVNYFVGAEYFPKNEDVFGLYSITPNFRLSEKWMVFAEAWSYFSSFPDDTNVGVGGAYTILPNLQVDASFGMIPPSQYGSMSNAMTLKGGVSWKIK